MTALPRFENTWTFGNTLTLIAMIIGGFAVYADITSAIRVQEQALIQQRERMAEISLQMTQAETRTRALEMNSTRIDEKLLSINASLQRIEKVLTEGTGQ